MGRLEAWGGEMKCLRKEMRVRMSVQWTLYIWISYDSISDGERVHMTALPLLPDLNRYS